jgi:hypothetical protein
MSEPNPLELTLNQKFEKERFARVIKESTSIEDLRKIANVLLDGWYTQRAASQWMIREAMSAPARTTAI